MANQPAGECNYVTIGSVNKRDLSVANRPFLANMWWEYFSFNIWTVVYQSELELSD